MNYHALSFGDVGLAAGMMAVNIGLSVAFQLGLERSLLWASVRMTAQLLLVGYALEWIFSLQHPLPVLAMALLMAGIAGVTAVQHTSGRFPGVYWDALVAVLGVAFVVMGLVLLGILRISPWYQAQYVIPLLGMVLGNAMNGVTLALDRFLQGLRQGRGRIETYLALGATRWEAARPEIREAIRIGMIPTINSMLVTGIVSLPGMMTGQILAGASPIDAVRYQIMVVFMLAAATGLASLAILLLAFRRLFDARHRLRLDLIVANDKQARP